VNRLSIRDAGAKPMSRHPSRQHRERRFFCSRQSLPTELRHEITVDRRTAVTRTALTADTIH
jgi:hypothetical protein